MKTVFIHKFVWDTFGDRPRNGRVLQIDHIDNCKTNNRIDNLQLLSQRANVSKGFRSKKTSSQYTGVCLDKRAGKWRAGIMINGKIIHLGYFTDEREASEAYQVALARIKTKGQKWLQTNG